LTTITGIKVSTRLIRATRDRRARGKGREVRWSVSELDGFRHGRAETIYKPQDETLDHTSLSQTRHGARSERELMTKRVVGRAALNQAARERDGYRLRAGSCA